MPLTLLLLILSLQEEIRIHSGLYKPAAPTLAVQAYSVELSAAVTDRHNHPVPNLKAADFELLDNGKPQTITFFEEQKSSTSAQTPQPRSIALFFDDTHTENLVLQKSRDAAKKFLTEGVRPGDRLALVTTSGAPQVDFTTDPAPLLAALDQLRTHPEFGARGLTTCPALNPYQAYAIENRLDIDLKRQKVAEAIPCNCGPEPSLTCIQAQDGAVQDAATAAWAIFKPQSASAIERLTQVLRYLAQAPGSRTLLILSPGFPSGGLEQKTSAFFDAALRAHIVVSALNSNGLSTRRSQGTESPVLGELMSNSAHSTGGRYIENNNDLAASLHSLADPNPDSYLLAFTPTAPPDDKFHALKLKVKSGDHVQSRPGYFSTKPDPIPEPIQHRIDRLASSTDSLDQIPATIQITGSVQIDIAVDARYIKFSSQSGRSVQQLTFVTLILDPSGAIIQAKQAVVDLALTPAKLADLQEKGIEATTSFTLPPGHYQLREIIREALENRITARTLPITVR